MTTTILRYFAQRPSLLFLTDSVGAFMTCFMLLGVLPNLEDHFAMPAPILTLLGIIAAAFFIYSGICFFLVKHSWGKYLSIIMVANILYCCLTVTILILYYPSLTYLDISYFVGEIIIVSLLVFIEYQTTLALKNLKL